MYTHTHTHTHIYIYIYHVFLSLSVIEILKEQAERLVGFGGPELHAVGSWALRVRTQELQEGHFASLWQGLLGLRGFRVFRAFVKGF